MGILLKRANDMSQERGKRSGEGLARTWRMVFRANERRKHPCTDEQLRQVMEREFPMKIGRTTIGRVGSMRGHYNAGTGMFERYGSAEIQSRKWG